MRKLSRFLEVPFDDRNISVDELCAFGSDHLQRAIANNVDGIFTERIPILSAALGAVEDGLTNDQLKLGLRKARKLAKNNFRETLPAGVAKIHGVVVGRYGADAPEVLECFPQGRKVFSACTDDHLDNHLQTLVDALTARQADLGAAVVTEASGLLTNWNAIYTASEASTGAKTLTQEEKNAARLTLQLELFKNLLIIAEKFARQPEKLALFMQQSLLEDHPAAEDPETPENPE